MERESRRSSRIETLHVGLGAIGRVVLGLARRSPELRPVAAVDPNSEAARAAQAAGAPIYKSVRQALDAGVSAEVALHATGSHLREVFPQIRELAEAGLDVVSTCEELAFPYVRHPKIARDLDTVASIHECRILGTGVNPGYVMDALVLFLTALVEGIKSIRVSRRVDTSLRRPALREKTGAGIDLEEFRRRAEASEIGHVGLLESLFLLARGLEWGLVEHSEALYPYLDEKEQVLLGVRQRVTGTTAGGHRIELELEMAAGHPQPGDHIEITGRRSLDVEIVGGASGDLATAAIVVNCVPALVRSDPGLRLMTDFVPLCARPLSDAGFGPRARKGTARDASIP